MAEPTGKLWKRKNNKNAEFKSEFGVFAVSFPSSDTVATSSLEDTYVYASYLFCTFTECSTSSCTVSPTVSLSTSLPSANCGTGIPSNVMLISFT
jgi:hypothetical protein